MGFNKRYINHETSLTFLKEGRLKDYYGKSDMLIFDDSLSSEIYQLYKSGLSDSDILLKIKNMEETTNEMYQSN